MPDVHSNNHFSFAGSVINGKQEFVCVGMDHPRAARIKTLVDDLLDGVEYASVFVSWADNKLIINIEEKR